MQGQHHRNAVNSPHGRHLLLDTELALHFNWGMCTLLLQIQHSAMSQAHQW